MADQNEGRREIDAFIDHGLAEDGPDWGMVAVNFCTSALIMLAVGLATGWTLRKLMRKHVVVRREPGSRN